MFVIYLNNLNPYVLQKYYKLSIPLYHSYSLTIYFPSFYSTNSHHSYFCFHKQSPSQQNLTFSYLFPLSYYHCLVYSLLPQYFIFIFLSHPHFILCMIEMWWNLQKRVLLLNTIFFCFLFHPKILTILLARIRSSL